MVVYGAYTRTRRHDGSPGWARIRGYVRPGADGLPRPVASFVRDITQQVGLTAERRTREEERRRHTRIVEGTAAALAHSRSVRDVIDVLGGPEGLERLGLVNLIMGVVEAGRIELVAEGQAGSYVPDTRITRIGDEFPMSEVARTLTPRFLTSRGEFAACYPRLWPHVEPLDISSAAYLPLIAQGRPIGVLGLFYREENAFGPDDRNLLLTLANGIAQSLQRAMLYDQERDLATGLQRAMLPRTIPHVSRAEIAVRYRSARLGRDIGGDWYDVIPLPDGRVGAVIGDVQGHDTEAAALMGQVRIVLRAYAAEGHPPATVMARASAFLRELDTGRFATCTYVEADLTTGALRIVRAGHIEPLVRRADGSGGWLPVEGGLPLGIPVEFGRLDYPVTTAELGLGDTLLMCTDGLVERPGSGLEEGMRMLADEVRRWPDDVNKLADRLCGLAEERPGADDMALLLLTRRAPSE